MSTFIPIASACHSLQLPPNEKDDRLNLNVRTGSASTLYHSFIFAFGGLTIGLELTNITVDEILETFKQRLNNSKIRKLERYLSGEFFYLNLIERYWKRLIIPANNQRPKARLFHEICAIDNHVYVFGGLVISDELIDEDIDSCDLSKVLIPCNDLWELSLETRKWTLLHDGSNYENDQAIPSPRYSYKMTAINSLSFANKKDHFGILIAGGKNAGSEPIYDNAIFDLVEKKYVGPESIYLKVLSDDKEKNKEIGLDYVNNVDNEGNLNIDYTNSIILNFNEEVGDHASNNSTGKLNSHNNKKEIESIIVYIPTKDSFQQNSENPLLSFKLGRSIKSSRPLDVHQKKIEKELGNIKRKSIQTIPYNLRYPIGGIFGQNIIITGFLKNEFDISIFIYNKPTGKWSRLNIFCCHNYGSHRFWGGFVWQSHHKVVLIGNYVTSKTTSSIRYFSMMITVSLRITNILVSSELAETKNYGLDTDTFLNKNESVSNNSIDSEVENENSTTEILSDESSEDIPIKTQSKKGPSNSQSFIKSSRAISFSEYVHYAAPKANFTTLRSVFPPEAITLGRNAFNRYGDLLSDFEFISASGDRIPASLTVLMKRWGMYFNYLLAKGYVKAIDRFVTGKGPDAKNKSLKTTKISTSISKRNKLKTSASANNVSLVSLDDEPARDRSSYHIFTSKVSSKSQSKEVPQFRLPFQESIPLSKSTTDSSQSTDSPGIQKRPSLVSVSSAIDPYNMTCTRKDSDSSFLSNSSLLSSHFQDIPPQLPLPSEPIPVICSTLFRNSSRKNSADSNSPRSSLFHTLTALRNGPTPKTSRESPFSSPKTSICINDIPIGDNTELFSCIIPNLKQSSEKPNKTKNESNSNDLSDSNESVNSIQESKVRIANKDQRYSSIASNDPVERERKCQTMSSSQYESPSNSWKEFDEPKKYSDTDLFSNSLLNFEDIENGKFRLEPSLIPRKLYMPFSTTTIKAFCEYLYTGQVGNKWLLNPTTLDNLTIAKYFKLPLLYDLISEVLFGIIGRKETYIIREGNMLKKKYFELLDLTNTPLDPDFKFPLDDYSGFMDTVDDGYLDIALLKKTISINKNRPVSNKKKKLSVSEDVPKEDKNELTDESSDMITSEEEDDKDFVIEFLNTPDITNVGPHSKSVFDKTHAINEETFQRAYNKDNNEFKDDEELKGDKTKILTLEQLSSTNSDIPNDHIIDLIYQNSTIVADLKLMLRAANAIEMSKLLKEIQLDLQAKIENLSKKYEDQKLDEAIEVYIEPETLNSKKSASSLTSINIVKSYTQIEDIKSKTYFGSSSVFSAFKQDKTDPKLDNKELDKRITKLIKKDKKLKSKVEKDEKLKRSQNEKLEKKQEKAKKETAKKSSKETIFSRHYPILLRNSSKVMNDDELQISSLESSISKHLSILNIGHLKKEPPLIENLSPQPSKLQRIQSLSSIQTTSSKISYFSDKQKNKKFGKKSSLL